MISVIGLGTGASKIVSKFEGMPQYKVYQMNDNIKRTTKYKYRLKKYPNPEEYEENIPDVKKFFQELEERVQFYVIGATYSSNYTLGILEQIKDKEIELFYVKPDTELLSGVPRLMERAAFGVLQQYARSGLLQSITLISNLKLETILHNTPVKAYYDSLNGMIQSTVHYANYFEHNEPEIGVVAQPSEISRIRTFGVLNMKNLEENWFFDLDIDRDVCYYLCINQEIM